MISRRTFVKNTVITSAIALAAQVPVAAETANPANRMRFGANYVPRKSWWYCWLDWDQQAVQDDLEGIASLGMDHIRVPLLWSLFQPGINYVSERSLANLGLLLEASNRAGLDVELSVLNGWMSGFSYLPAWVAPLNTERKGETWNIFTSAAVMEGEKLLFRRVAETVGKHRSFMGFDLGNELGVLMKKSNPVSMVGADAWATEMLRYCDEIAPGKFHVNGVDHSHWFNDFGFSRKTLANTGHASICHSYVYFTGVLERYKYSDAASLHVADFMIELAYAYQSDLNRRVWLQEIGVGPVEMPETYKPTYMDATVRNVAATGKAWGITWWCSHDMDRGIQGFSPYEYELGLLDLKNKRKPMGEKFAQLAAEFKGKPPTVLPRKTAIVIPESGLLAAGYPPDWRFANSYMNVVRTGRAPAIVLESRSTDETYLKARGITEILPCLC